MSFSYILEKIENASFVEQPFKHLEIFDFFKDEDFERIVNSSQVSITTEPDDGILINELQRKGYHPIHFPGSTEDIQAYIQWHSGKGKHANVETCEGFGITFRLAEISDEYIKSLNDFFNSDAFKQCVSNKFEIRLDDTYPDNGLQKYLDGYEISPHPDIRKKALTYMINVNFGSDSESENFHTHYMKFVDSKRYVEEYWKYNESVDRCWVPWDWCKSVKRQTKNNSFVMFSPSNSTIHAIKASYDHYRRQRTQFYGNFWYHKSLCESKANWRDYVIVPTMERRNSVSFKKKISKFFRQMS